MSPRWLYKSILYHIVRYICYWNQILELTISEDRISAYQLLIAFVANVLVEHWMSVPYMPVVEQFWGQPRMYFTVS